VEDSLNFSVLIGEDVKKSAPIEEEAEDKFLSFSVFIEPKTQDMEADSLFFLILHHHRE